MFDDWTGGQFAGWSTEHRATESHVGVFRVLGRVNFSGRKLGQQIAAIGDIPASFRWLAKVPRDRRLHSAGSRRCLGIVGFVRRSRVFDGWTVEQFAGWSTEHSRRFPRGSFSSFGSRKLSWPEIWAEAKMDIATSCCSLHEAPRYPVSEAYLVVRWLDCRSARRLEHRTPGDRIPRGSFSSFGSRKLSWPETWPADSSYWRYSGFIPLAREGASGSSASFRWLAEMPRDRRLRETQSGVRWLDGRTVRRLEHRAQPPIPTWEFFEFLVA